MLGGYYLGQAYLGISGWTATGTLTVQGATHEHTADEIVLVQKHTLSVSDSAHSHEAEGNIVLDKYLLLNVPDPGVFLVTSHEIPLIQNHTLLVDNTLHQLINSLARVIDWAEYNRYFGIYIKDFGDRTKNVDTLVPAEPHSGTLITEFSAFGRYK